MADSFSLAFCLLFFFFLFPSSLAFAVAYAVVWGRRAAPVLRMALSVTLPSAHSSSQITTGCQRNYGFGAQVSAVWQGSRSALGLSRSRKGQCLHVEGLRQPGLSAGAKFPSPSPNPGQGTLDKAPAPSQRGRLVGGEQRVLPPLHPGQAAEGSRNEGASRTACCCRNETGGSWVLEGGKHFPPSWVLSPTPRSAFGRALLPGKHR